MRCRAPIYYQKFKCIADRCRHSCCVGWEIDVDEESRRIYRSLTGEIGNTVRAALVEDAEGAHFALQPNGRCALLDDRGLCRLISAVGEEYLCDICREHPRFYNEVGDCLECGIGACCEEAARLMLEEPDYRTLVCVWEESCEENPITVSDFDAKTQREQLYDLLSNGTCTYADRLKAISAMYDISEAALSDETVLKRLEYLYDEHRSLFAGFSVAPMAEGGDAAYCERFLAYLIYRHASGAHNGQEFRLAVGSALLLERFFRTLWLSNGLMAAESARIVSEEMEYSEENIAVLRHALLCR